MRCPRSYFASVMTHGSLITPVPVTSMFAVPPAAVSLREALTDASKSFESTTAVHVALTFGSSGQLAAQIANGAPIDAFISAANQQVEELSDSGDTPIA